MNLAVGLRAAALAAAAFAVPHGADAAEWSPAKPIRIVVGFSPGTTTDITARTLGLGLSERLGQPVVIDNREGANSGIANAIVGKATADGQTLLIGTLSMVTGPLLYRDLPFDPKDFAPVSLLVIAQNVISVNPKVPASSIAELIAAAKAQPGRLRYASSGRGSSAFLTLELLNSMAGIKLEEIPYKSSAQALTDLISGEIPIYPPNLVAGLVHIRSGRIRPLAVTGARRSPIVPDIPAVAETLPGYDASTGIYGIMVPARTPAAIVERLHREVAQVTASPLFRERMQGQGADVIGSSPAEYAEFLRSQDKKWRALFDRLGVGRQ